MFFYSSFDEGVSISRVQKIVKFPLGCGVGKDKRFEFSKKDLNFKQHVKMY